MSVKIETGAAAEFVCSCPVWMQEACDSAEFNGTGYCVFHYPGKEKVIEFRAALKRKRSQKNFEFLGYWFPEDVSFNGWEFPKETVVRFNNATFLAGATFWATRFYGVVFYGATFKGSASFASAQFHGPANFRRVTFKRDADFGSHFGDLADFRGAVFEGKAEFASTRFAGHADFGGATFLNGVRFAGYNEVIVFGENSSLNLQFAEIRNPSWVTFHTVSLHPHWLLEVDPRKFQLTAVHWNNYGNARRELALMTSKKFSSPHGPLATTCRRIAANYERNDRYREASHFRRMALDSERQATWHGHDVRRLNWWYWLASGYGERPFQALMVLVAILVLFGALYTQVGFARWEPRLASEAEVATAKKDEVGAPLRFSRALTYSTGVLTFQRPEPKPATTAAQTLVLFETILGPVQAALLALAIRRKFMR